MTDAVGRRSARARLSAAVRGAVNRARAAPGHVTARRLAVGAAPVFLRFIAIAARDSAALPLAPEAHRAGLQAALRLHTALLTLMAVATVRIVAALREAGPDAALRVARLTVACFHVLPAWVTMVNNVSNTPGFQVCVQDADPMTCTPIRLVSGDWLLGPSVCVVLYLVSGLPARVAFGAELLRLGGSLSIGAALAAAHSGGVTLAWLAGAAARGALQACALPVIAATVSGASDPAELARLQLCPRPLRPVSAGLVAIGDTLHGLCSLQGVQCAIAVGMAAYLMSYATAPLCSAHSRSHAAVGWACVFAIAAGRAVQLHRRRLRQQLRLPERRAVYAMHQRLNVLDTDPVAMLQAAAEELVGAFPHGCSVAVAEFAACSQSSKSLGADGSPARRAAAPSLLRVRRVRACSCREAAVSLLVTAVPAGMARGGSAAAALEHPDAAAGLTLDAENYTEGTAAFADWAAIGAGGGNVSVTLLGYGLDIMGALWVHAPAGVSAPSPAVLSSFATAVGAAMLRAAAARERLAAAAAAARADADATLALQRAFMGSITHELRTPLNAIIGFGSTILDETTRLEPHLRDYLQSSIVAGGGLLAVVNQLLDYAKFEACNGEADTVLTDEPLCLSAVLDSVVGIAAGKALAGGVTLCVELDDALQAARLRGDPPRMHQVLCNLVDNALKFSPDGASVCVVAAACEPVELPEDVLLRPPCRDADAPPQQWVRITVADTGRGVAPEQQGRLFKPFSQVARLPGEKPTGTGLGLVLCRSLVRQMGGSISFTSQPGVGTTFTIVVPFDCETAPPARRSSVPAHVCLSGVTVLTALPAAPLVSACVTRAAAAWGAVARELAPPALEQQLRAQAAAASQGVGGAAASRAVVLIVDAPLLTALCGTSAPPLPPNVVCVIAAGPSERAAWQPAAAAARGCAAPAVFLEMPTSPGRLRARLAAAMEAAAANAAAAAAANAPIASAAAALASPPATPRSSVFATAQYAALRVLLAEDNAMNARVAAAVLGRCGVSAPKLAPDGAQALAAATEEAPYDIIIMDQYMPVMSGPDAVRRLRAHEAATGRPRAWVVACSASSAVEDREECMAAGMDAFLEKPVRPEGMRAMLQRFDAERPGSAAASAADALSVDASAAPAAAQLDCGGLAQHPVKAAACCLEAAQASIAAAPARGLNDAARFAQEGLAALRAASASAEQRAAAPSTSRCSTLVLGTRQPSQRRSFVDAGSAPTSSASLLSSTSSPRGCLSMRFSALGGSSGGSSMVWDDASTQLCRCSFCSEPSSPPRRSSFDADEPEAARLHRGLTAVLDSVARVQSSFARLEPDLAAHALAMTQTFVSQAPSVLQLVHGKRGLSLTDPEMGPIMVAHQVTLLRLVGSAVSGQRDWDGELAPTLLRCGRMHARFGDSIRNFYPPCGAAMMDTLRGALRNDCTPDVAAAWEAAFAFVATHMVAGIDAAQQALGEEHTLAGILRGDAAFAQPAPAPLPGTLVEVA